MVGSGSTHNKGWFRQGGLLLRFGLAMCCFGIDMDRIFVFLAYSQQW